MFQFRFNFLAHWPLTEPPTVSAQQIFIFDERFTLRFPHQLVAIVTMIFRFEKALFNPHHFVSASGETFYLMKLF